jgi:hypothetical protein
MAMVHYEIPRANSLPQGDVYAAYERFLHELNQVTDSRHAAARQRFIASVRALRAGRS